MKHFVHGTFSVLDHAELDDVCPMCSQSRRPGIEHHGKASLSVDVVAIAAASARLLTLISVAAGISYRYLLSTPAFRFNLRSMLKLRVFSAPVCIDGLQVCTDGSRGPHANDPKLTVWHFHCCCALYQREMDSGWQLHRCTHWACANCAQAEAAAVLKALQLTTGAVEVAIDADSVICRLGRLHASRGWDCTHPDVCAQIQLLTCTSDDTPFPGGFRCSIPDLSSLVLEWQNCADKF